MARIRSIKPEFWTDDKNLDLSDSCALFFVALWNFCDDEGKIENQVKTIQKRTGRWTIEKVKLFIKTLSASGQLRVSSCSAWLQVVNWSHQRINRPVPAKIKAKDIQWVTDSNSVSPHGSLSEASPQGEDRIGEDKDGSGYTRQLADKQSVWEEICNDGLWVENMNRTHPGRDVKKGFDECWNYHSVKPSPPVHAWEWKQKLNTWLIKDQRNDFNPNATANKKQQHNRKLAADFEKTYGPAFRTGQSQGSNEPSPIDH